MKKNNGHLYGYLRNENNNVLQPGLDEISHLLTNFTWEDKKLYADVSILDTLDGKILKSILDLDPEHDFKFHIRCLGEVSDEKLTITNIFSWDIY